MEGRALMLTERIKRVFLQQANGVDYAFLLAPLPVIGYLISLAHQYGELIFYGYPSYFLEIETSIVIKNTIVVLPLCGIACFLLIFLVTRLVNGKNIIYALIIFTMAVIALVTYVYPIIIPVEYHNKTVNTLLCASITVLFFFLGRMFNKSYIKGVCLGIIFIAIGSITIGYSSTAYKPYRYIINKSDDTYLVVKTYKDNYLTAPINLKTNEVSPAFELLKMSKDDGSETIERKEIRIITVKKVHQD